MTPLVDRGWVTRRLLARSLLSFRMRSAAHAKLPIVVLVSESRRLDQPDVWDRAGPSPTLTAGLPEHTTLSDFADILGRP